MGHDGNVNPKQWGNDRGAKEWLVARIIGVSHKCHTGSKELGSSGFYGDRTRRVASRKSELVISPRAFSVFELGL